MMQIKKTLLFSIFFNLFIHNAWAMELDGEKDKNLLPKQLTSSSKQEKGSLNTDTDNEKPIYLQDVLMSRNRLEALKSILQIPARFVIDKEGVEPYHRRVELEILSEIIESLEEFISLLNMTTFDLTSRICMQNRFVEYAARYMLYYESTLNYYDKAEKHDIFDAIKIIRNISPSLSLEKCQYTPLNREEITDGLCYKGNPPLGFSSIFPVLLIMDGFETTPYQEKIHDLRMHLKRLKQIRSYFDIDEHLRVTLPLIERIGKFKFSSLKANEEELDYIISEFENLFGINEKIPYKLQKIALNDAEQARETLKKSKTDCDAEAFKLLAHSLISWVDLRNLALLGAHATSPWFESILFLPKNKVILSESLPMIVEEFAQLIPLIEQVIIAETGAVLEIPTTPTITETPPFTSIALLSKYGSDTAYLHKVRKSLKHLDFSSSLPNSAIMRIFEILGEASNNISSLLKSSNPVFWRSLKQIRNSQHKISYQKKLIKALENDTELAPFLLKDFQEVHRFSEEIMSVLPQSWEELKSFYNNPLRDLKIKGAGIKKLKELIDSFSLTSEDYDILHSTIQSYKGVKEHRFFIEDILARSIDIITPTKEQVKEYWLLKEIFRLETLRNYLEPVRNYILFQRSPTNFFSHVDALGALSGKNKKELKEAYKKLKQKKLLGKSEADHNTKIANLKALLIDVKDLSPQELSTEIGMQIQKIHTYSLFTPLQTKLERLGISDIETWKKKWNKTQKQPSNSQIKKKENTKNKSKIIKDSLGASGEIIKHFNALNQLMGGSCQNRSIFKDKAQRLEKGPAEDLINYKILLSTEHHITMIRHYVGVIQEAHDYLKRHDIADPFCTALSELCWVLKAKLKDICLMGNSIAHLHDVTHDNEIKIGEYSYHFINYSNITLYLDGRSCDCINCRDLPPSPYKTSVVEELTLYKTVMERIISAGTKHKQVTDYWFLKQIFPFDTVKKCILLQYQRNKLGITESSNDGMKANELEQTIHAPKLNTNPVKPTKNQPDNLEQHLCGFQEQLDNLVRQESLQFAMNEGKIGPRNIPGWVLQDVDDLGNCFYDAIIQQMKIINHYFLKTVPPETLPRDSLRLCIQGGNFNDEEWAEDKQIDEFVKKFDVILAIIDTRTPENGYVYYFVDSDGHIITKHPDDDAISLPNKPFLKLAATGNHFLSVVSESNY